MKKDFQTVVSVKLDGHQTLDKLKVKRTYTTRIERAEVCGSPNLVLGYRAVRALHNIWAVEPPGGGTKGWNIVLVIGITRGIFHLRITVSHSLYFKTDKHLFPLEIKSAGLFNPVAISNFS